MCESIPSTTIFFGVSLKKFDLVALKRNDICDQVAQQSVVRHLLEKTKRKSFKCLMNCPEGKTMSAANQFYSLAA
jgi:hypothetical protein